MSLDFAACACRESRDRRCPVSKKTAGIKRFHPNTQKRKKNHSSKVVDKVEVYGPQCAYKLGNKSDHPI